jgi:hypothetical protein
MHRMSMLAFVLVIMVSALGSQRASAEMKLWKEIDISDFSGTFPCLGDLDNDGRVDFLLYRQGPQTTPGYLVAVDHDGKKLWEMGDSSIKGHSPDGVPGRNRHFEESASSTTSTRTAEQRSSPSSGKTIAPCCVCWTERRARSKRSGSRRSTWRFASGKRSRCHPLAKIAFLKGKDLARRQL